MLDVDPGYAAAARTSHRVAFHADVVAWDRSATLAERIPLTGGSIKVAGGLVRRTGTLAVTDATGRLRPRRAGDLLHPYSHHHLRVTATVTTPEGAWPIQLGTLRLRGLDVSAGPAGVTMSLKVADDAEEAVQGRFWPPNGGENRPAEPLEARVRAALAASHAPAGAGLIAPTTGITVPPGAVSAQTEKAHESLVALCAGHGYDLAVAPSGAWQLRPATPGPAITFGPGGGRATVVAESFDLAGFSNAASFFATAFPSGLAYAYDTTVPETHPLTGRWGVVAVHERSEQYNRDHAQYAADQLLAREHGGTRKVTFRAVPDYRLEAGDRVTLDLGAQGVAGTFVVDSVTFPLTVGAEMAVECQETRGA